MFVVMPRVRIVTFRGGMSMVVVRGGLMLVPAVIVSSMLDFCRTVGAQHSRQK